MKLLLIPVWASLVAGAAHASVLSNLPVTPEPSNAAMLIVGVCAVAFGLKGRRGRTNPE